MWGNKSQKGLKIKAVRILMLAAMALNMVISIPQTAFAATAKTFDFVEVTDFHGALNPVGSTQPVAAVLAKQIKDIKAANPDSVILSGGDMFQGSALSNILKGQPVIEMMKNIGFDAMALGNHEYDWGIDTVIDSQNAVVKGTSIPVLAANVYDKTTGKPVSYIKPDVMLEKDGVKIGVIGVVDNKEFPSAISQALIQDVDFKNPVPIVNQLAKDLKSQGAQIVVVLAHMGASTDNSGAVSGNLIDMAQQLSGVDAIFGGHTHNIIATRVNGIPVGIANVSGKGYLDLKVTLNVDGTVSTGDMNYQDDVSLYKAQTPLVDPDVQAIVAKASQDVGPTINEVLGQASVDLTRAQSTTPYGDSILGNWTSQVTKDAMQTDFAFTNNGALGCDLLKGDIKVAEMWALMPYDDMMYTMKMTGAQIKTVLEDAVQDGGLGIQVAGLSFTYDPAKPTMNRITLLKKSDGTPIELTQTYKVAANDFLANGGDLFTGFTDPAIVDKIDTGKLVRDVFSEAVKTQKTVTAAIDNRIQANSVLPDVTPTLLALGDSIAYGMSATPGSDYVDLLYHHVLTLPTYSQLSLNNLAVSGDTSSTLLGRLQTAPYIAAVGNAKVITLSIGGDNLLSPIIGAVCTAFGVNRVNNPNLMTDLATAMSTNPNKDAILAGIVNSPSLTQALQAGVSQFGADFPKIVGTLKALSPQAQIYVLNLYNPFNAQDPLYTVFDPLINGINQGISSNALAGYKVADVYTQFKMTPGAVNFNLAMVQLDPHPTTIGHAAIYQTILDAESGQIPIYYTVSMGTLTGGSITANPILAKPGTTINLTINPDAGMQLQAGTLKYNDGTTDHVISSTSFILPEANVTVTAVFEQVVAYPTKYNVPGDKIWTITFNQELDLSVPLGDYISVTDSQNIAIPIVPAFGSDGKSITLNPPQGGYSSGGQYVLNIYKGLKSKTGALISKSVKMLFVVK